jgi:hypothetical protein
MSGHQPHEVLQDIPSDGSSGTNQGIEKAFFCCLTAGPVHGIEGRAFHDVGMQSQDCDQDHQGV